VHATKQSLSVPATSAQNSTNDFVINRFKKPVISYRKNQLNYIPSEDKHYFSCDA